MASRKSNAAARWAPVTRFAQLAECGVHVLPTGFGGEELIRRSDGGWPALRGGGEETTSER